MKLQFPFTEKPLKAAPVPFPAVITIGEEELQFCGAIVPVPFVSVTYLVTDPERIRLLSVKSPGYILFELSVAEVAA